MKKRFLIPVLLVGALSLVSCGSNSMDIVNEDSEATNITNADAVASTSNQNTTTTTSTLEPNYVSLDVDASKTDLTSDSTLATTTVEKSYGSVVSITAQSQAAKSSGSGVLYQQNKDYGLSFIVTCFHVIDGATNFTVTYNNGTMDEDEDLSYTATLVGGNEDSDLAVLSIEATDLVYADIFTNSDNLKLGSPVVCIGNPLGTLPGSVSSGVVSFVNRKIDVDSYTSRKLIQTDVAINSGNSGGGLFNTAGALIGIVNAKYSSSSIEGLGFAIPSKEVISVIEEITDTAKYDINNENWDFGYVTGDFEFGFTISLGTTGTNMYMRSYVLYVSSVDQSNSTLSGNSLTTEQVISKITVDYLEDGKDDLVYTVPESLSSTSATEATKFLYDANMSLGDKVTFTYSNKDTSSFNIIQYIYSI